MKNYISLNGEKIELTEAQVAEMAKSLGITQVELKMVPVGDVIKIGEYEFIVLEHAKDTTAVILKDLLHNSVSFGDCNNYNDSKADNLCVDFGKKMAGIIGEDNLIEHTVDLTSDDGLKDYGSVKRKMSLITCDLYRRYVEILDKHKLDKWWWLATAFSTPKHDDDDWIKCVSPSGYFSGNYFNYFYGVRPFCILKSNIFVSK